MRSGMPRKTKVVSTAITSVMLLSLGVIACSPQNVVGNAPLPPDLADPRLTETPAGAVSAYFGTLARFRDAFGPTYGGVAAVTGLLTDELQDGGIGAPPGALSSGASLDARVLPEVSDPVLESGALYTGGTYGALHAVRGQARQARGLLVHFGGDTLRALTGHLYAIEGYADIFLADLFCSGIPLSTIDFGGDYTFRPGSSTSEVYAQAGTLFDSALALAADSARIVTFGRIGKARALLALGRYGDAAQTVAQVPDGFQYFVFYQLLGVVGGNVNFAALGNGGGLGPWAFTVADREGLNGLSYRGSGDPRTASTAIGTNQFGRTLYHPNKYAGTGDSPMVVADWVEARLIEAEAALQAGDVATWLGKVNHLRQTAISPALRDTTDPGTPGARVDLLFRERAFWLFLTGHRQGDMRRLIRQYGRDPNAVYPTGIYPGGPNTYGTSVNAPVPAAERLYNPQFTGCINRGA